MRFRIEAGTALWLAVVVVIALLLLPLPVEEATRRWPALTQELENLGHPLAFAVLAHLAFQTLRRRYPMPSPAPYWLVLVGAVFFGFMTEALQRVVGRDSAWIDLVNDVLGASFALLLLARREADPRRGGSAVYAATAVLLALLATGPFLWTMVAYAHRAHQMPVLWRTDSTLFSRFSHWQGDNYRGLNIEEPAADWSDYETLAVDVRNLRDEPVRIVVRVHDIQHDMSRDQRHEDRFNRSWELPPGAAQTLRIPLEEIRHAPQGRTMDLTAISGIVVFQSVANVPAYFRVDEIRLER
jgi:VanZ family protein